MITIPDFPSVQRIETPSEPGHEASAGRLRENVDFGDVLRGALAARQDAFKSSASAALTGRQLTLILRALQIQMNSRLFHSIFNMGDKADYTLLRQPAGCAPAIAAGIGGTAKSATAIEADSPAETHNDFSQIIKQAADAHDVDSALVESVIKAESGFNPLATSPAGAMGLMQLMPDTARELGVKNPYDPRESIMAGTRYLKMLLNRYGGEVNAALAAYNWGMGNLEKNPNRLPDETLSYIEKVNSHYKMLKG
jgi:soluble lytic murein transglycosylase-like protein